MATFAALLAGAEESEEELAKKKTLSPVADLISLPLKLDDHRSIGSAQQGNKTALTVQPVMPS